MEIEIRVATITTMVVHMDAASPDKCVRVDMDKDLDVGVAVESKMAVGYRETFSASFILRLRVVYAFFLFNVCRCTRSVFLFCW